MKAVLLYVLLAVIIDGCSAKRGRFGGSSGSSTNVELAIAVTFVTLGALLLFVLILFCCIKKCKKPKKSVLPSQTQVAIMQQENQYAPPPYGQPSFYQSPPSYPSFNDPTKVTFT
jgi:hypothetical protein